MATKTIKKNSKKTADILKNKAQKLNKVALETSRGIVDETIATGEEWQAILAKTLKKSTKLFGKQQDLVLTTLEELKGQYRYGNKRFWQLLSFKPTNAKTSKPATKKFTKATAKTASTIDEVMETTTKAAKKTAKKVVKSVKASKNLAAVPMKKAAANKATVKKATPKKVTAVKKTTVKKAVKADDLTKIEGIGPKIAGLLRADGIITFTDLSKSKPAQLKNILTNAGSRFQMHDPSTWAAQAKLAAAGKMDELKVLQKELKGGK